MNNSLRCSNCALLNFATATVCKRCGLQLNSADENAGWDAPADVPPANPGQPTEGASFFWDQPSYQPSSQQSFRPNYAPPPVVRSSGGSGIIRILIVLAVIGAISALAIPKLLKKKGLDLNAVSWNEYHSPDNKFSVSLPAAPKIRDVTIPSPFGDARAQMLEAEVSKEGGCMLMYADYPQRVNVSEDTLYDMAIQGATSRQKIFNVAARRYITLDGHRGVEATMSPKDPSMKASAVCRIFWVSPRLYVIVAGGLDTPEYKAVQTRCLDSFRLNAGN